MCNEPRRDILVETMTNFAFAFYARNSKYPYCLGIAVRAAGVSGSSMGFKKDIKTRLSTLREQLFTEHHRKQFHIKLYYQSQITNIFPFT
jgi:hypothetical protein